MKVLVMVKATADSENGVMPTEKLMTEMGQFNEELVQAGIILAGEGLHPSSAGARVKFSGSDRSVTEGPFPHTNELVAGFWIWQVKSMEDAIAWVKKCPNPMNGESEIEIRPIFTNDDFGEALTPQLLEQEEKLRVAVESYQLEAPRWEVSAERTIAGLKGHFNGSTRDQIPELWKTFGALLQNDDWVRPDSYGVSWNCGADGWDYLAGAEPKGATPAGTESLTLAAQRYAIFSHSGHVSTLDRTCSAIFEKWLPNSGHKVAEAPFFERYTEDFDLATVSGGIEVWVPIKA